MNENPEGTPNPLNPSVPNPSQPESDSPSEPVRPAVTTNRPTMDVVAPRNTSTAPNVPPVQESASPQTPPPADDFASFNPVARPMEKAPTPAPVQPKKKNIGLIIGAVVCGIVALGCIIAAIVVALTSGQADPVAKAIEKIVTGNAPTNTVVDGTVRIESNDPDSEITDANIAINSQMVTRSMINSTKATLTANLKNGGSFSMEFSEVYAANSNLYLKIDGLGNILNPSQTPTIEGDVVTDNDANCVDDGTGLTNCDSEAVDAGGALGMLSAFSGVIEKVNGNWIRISTDDLGSLTSLGDEEEGGISCVANLFTEATGNANTLSGIYNKYPFIASTNENLPVASLKDPIYKVSIDNDNFTKFMQEAENTEIFKDFTTCMGYGNSTVNVDNMVEDLNKLPEIYVEVDGNYDFTRLYFVANSEDNGQTIAVDLSLSYPANVNVSEPVEYKDLNELMQEIMTSMYGGEAALPEQATAF